VLYLAYSVPAVVEDGRSQFVARGGNHLNEQQGLHARRQSQEDPEKQAIGELGDQSPLGVVASQIETAARRCRSLPLGVATGADSFRFLGGPVSGDGLVSGSFSRLLRAYMERCTSRFCFGSCPITYLCQ